MLEKLARAYTRLGPKLRAHAHHMLMLAHARGFNACTQDFDARPMPIHIYYFQVMLYFIWTDEILLYSDES